MQMTESENDWCKVYSAREVLRQVIEMYDKEDEQAEEFERQWNKF